MGPCRRRRGRTTSRPRPPRAAAYAFSPTAPAVSTSRPHLCYTFVCNCVQVLILPSHLILLRALRFVRSPFSDDCRSFHFLFRSRLTYVFFLNEWARDCDYFIDKERELAGRKRKEVNLAVIRTLNLLPPLEPKHPTYLR